MKTNDRLDLARWATGFAQKIGADEASANVSNGRNIEVEIRLGKLENLKESTENSLSLSIYANHRYSSHSTNDLRRESLVKLIEEAVAMTKYLSEDEFRSLPDPKYYEGKQDIDLNILDPVYETVTSEQRVKLAREIDAIAKAQSDKIISCTGGYSDNYYESAKVHSNGFEGESRGTVFAAGAEATVDDGQGGRPEDWNWGVSRFLKDLPDANTLGKSAADRALRKIGQTKIESGKYDMIVENRSASRLLGSFSSAMSGSALQQRRSFLEGKHGQQVTSDVLTIIDDPFIPGAMGSRLFDGEGMAARKRTMVDKGVLKEYFISDYYGKKLGMEPTTGRGSNIVFEYGTRSLDEMLADIKQGIFVTGFLGGNSNSTTGDFSYGIMGLLVENGQIIKPVNEMNISGNHLEFWTQLVEMGNDPYVYSSWRRPSLYFTDVEFSGL